MVLKENKMSLIEKCNQIRELQSSDEDLAFQKLGEVMSDYKHSYTCDNAFYLYHVDETNNYSEFRKDTEIIFGLLHDMFYDEEQLSVATNDLSASEKEELMKYRTFLASIKVIQMNIRDIPFENHDNMQVKVFYHNMNYCNKYLTEIFQDMVELNNTMEELNNSLELLTNKLVATLS